jgi:hypothetical protein
LVGIESFEVNLSSFGAPRSQVNKVSAEALISFLAENVIQEQNSLQKANLKTHELHFVADGQGELR